MTLETLLNGIDNIEGKKRVQMWDEPACKMQTLYKTGAYNSLIVNNEKHLAKEITSIFAENNVLVIEVEEDYRRL